MCRGFKNEERHTECACNFGDGMTDELLLPGDDALSLSLYQAERMFASSSTLQSVLGVSTVDEARERIAFKEANGTEPRPTICCSLVSPLRFGTIAGGDGNFMRPAGEVWVYLAIDPPSEVLAAAAPNKAELMWAAKTFGAIVSEVAALSNQDQTADTDVTESHLGIMELSLLDFSCVPEEYWPTYGRFWWGVISAQWSDGQ